jgi:hypothetical protein
MELTTSSFTKREEHATSNIQSECNCSNLQKFEPLIKSEHQNAAPWHSPALVSPEWQTCDLDLSSYSQLFDSPPIKCSDNVLESNLEEAAQWDCSIPTPPIDDLLQGPMFPSSFACDGLTNADGFSTEPFNLEAFHSELSSLREYESHSSKGSQHEEQSGSENEENVPDLTPEDFGIPKQTSVKPRWTSGQRKNRCTEPQPTGRTKRIKTSAKTNNARQSRGTSKSPLKLQNTASTASRKSKPLTSGASEPPSPKGRKNHNLIERKYRSKLNGQFETLLATLPPDLVAEVNEARIAAKQPEKAISKAEVLALAKDHIEKLETERAVLETQKKALSGEVDDLKGIWMSLGGELMP